MIFKKSKEDHTLLNPLHSSLLSSKSNKNDQPNQLATIIFEDQALDESDKMNVNQPYLATIMINHKNSSTSGSTKRLAVDTPAVIEEGREEETEERDDNNREFSRQTSYNINTERDNVEIQPTINGNGLDHLSYTKILNLNQKSRRSTFPKTHTNTNFDYKRKRRQAERHMAASDTRRWSTGPGVKKLQKKHTLSRNKQ